MIQFRALALSAGLLAATTALAAAQSAIDVGVGYTALVQLGRSASSVIVGDPTVADVSVEGINRLAVFGKAPGGTSLTVLGADGKVLVSTEVVVHPATPSGVTVTYAGGKGVAPGGHTVVYACGTACVRTSENRKSPPVQKTAE